MRANKAVAWAMAGFFGILIGASWTPSAIGAFSDAAGGGAYGLKLAMMMVLTPMGILASISFKVCGKYYPEDMAKVQGYTLEVE